MRLIRDLRIGLLRFFRRRSPGMAEDLTHETLTNFVAARERLRDVRSLRWYIYTIARRNLAKEIGRVDSTPMLELDENEPYDLLPSGIVLDHIDILWRLQGECSGPMATVRAYYLGGMNAREIAQARKISEGAVRYQLRRGLALLRR